MKKPEKDGPMRAASVFAQKQSKLTQEMRDQLVLEHLPLVKAIAIRVHENLPSTSIWTI
jgi:hypothetical protein